MIKEKIEDLINLRVRIKEADELLKRMKRTLEDLEEVLLNEANEDGLTSYKLGNGINVLFSSRGYYSIIGGAKDPGPRRELFGKLAELGYQEKIKMVPEMEYREFQAVLKQLPINTKLGFIRDGLLSHYEKPIITVRGAK